jgi:hypothetical protein
MDNEIYIIVMVAILDGEPGCQIKLWKANPCQVWFNLVHLFQRINKATDECQTMTMMWMMAQADMTLRDGRTKKKSLIF